MANQAADYERQIGLPPIQLDSSHLTAILKTLSEALGRANTNTSTTWSEHFSITIKQEPAGEAVSWTEFSVPSLHLPSSANYLTMTYEKFNSPISEVSVILTDDYRVLEVHGDSFTDVESLALVLEHEFTANSVLFGGSAFRHLSALGAMLTFIILCFLPALSHRIRVFFVIMLLLTILSIFVIPGNRIMPGFIFRETDPSLLVRYGPHFGFLGLLLTVIIPAFQSIFGKRRRSRKGTIGGP